MDFQLYVVVIYRGLVLLGMSLIIYLGDQYIFTWPVNFLSFHEDCHYVVINDCHIQLTLSLAL